MIWLRKVLLKEVMMIEDSARDVSTARAAYEARPWLKHYPGYLGPEITSPVTNALDMFLKTVQALPEQAAIYYFDQTMSYAELDRKSSALAAALKELPQTLTGKFLRWELRDKAQQ